MNDKHFNFTKTKLENIPLPNKGSISYYDTKEKGLCLIVYEKGSKTFYFYKKVNGKPQRFKIGSLFDVSVEQARSKVAEFKNDLFKGENPNEKAKNLKQEITFKELFNEYMERYSKLHKKSWIYDEREVNKFLSSWFNKKISRITKQEIKELHDKIYKENGLYQANRLLERIRAIYNKAIEWGFKGTNPSLGIKKFKEKQRDRFLQKDELKNLLQALAIEENKLIRNYIYLSLFTGARKSNVLSMKWEDINFNTKEWNIKDSKNGENLIIPLVKEAIDILNECKQENISEYVFPSKNSKYGYLQDPKKTWNKILKNANLKDVRLHDLRRTLGSYQAITGSSLLVIGKSLGHKSSKATEVYSKLSTDPVRKSMETAIKEMMEDR